jgi:hypothetical protein
LLFIIYILVASEESQSQMGAGIATTTWCPKPRLQVELESEDPRSIKEVRVCGESITEPNIILHCLNTIRILLK